MRRLLFTIHGVRLLDDSDDLQQTPEHFFQSCPIKKFEDSVEYKEIIFSIYQVLIIAFHILFPGCGLS